MKGIPWWVYPLAALFSVAVADGAAYFLSIRGQLDQIASKEKTKADYEATIGRRTAVEQDLKKAKEEAAEARKRWSQIGKELVILKYPDEQNPQEVWEVGLNFRYEAGGYFERDLRQFLATLANDCGVDIRYDQVPQWSLPTLQLPPTPQTGFFQWGMMTLQVDGRYRDILNFLSRLPRFSRPILVYTPSFSLLGSGRVRATVAVSVHSLVETAVERAVLAGKTPPPTAGIGGAGTGGVGAGVPGGMAMPMMPMSGGMGAGPGMMSGGPGMMGAGGPPGMLGGGVGGGPGAGAPGGGGVLAGP